MKFIHTADWHIYDLHKYSIGSSRLDELKKNIILMIKYAIKNDIMMIIVAGDIFHNYNPGEKLLRIFTEIVSYAIKNNIYMRFITGNHDTNGINHSLESIHNISSLQDSDYLKIYSIKNGQTAIYSEIIDNVNYVYIPWQNNINSVIIDAKNYQLSDKKNILVTHLAVNGAKLENGYIYKSDDLDNNEFKGWDYVALGDFHTNQKVMDNVYYSGSIIKLKWSEINSKKLFNVYDTDNNSIKKVILPDIQFIEIDVEYDNINDLIEKTNDDFTNSYVKFIISGDIKSGAGIILLKDHIMKMGARDVFFKIIPKNSKLSDDKQNIELNLDIKSACAIYLENNNISDKNKYLEYLIEMIKKI